MITFKEAKQISFKFFKEACEHLNFDPKHALILLETLPFNQHAPCIMLNNNTLLINKDWFNKQINLKSLTPIRQTMYYHARIMYKKSIGNSNPLDSHYDAMAFSYTFMMIKGLHLAFPPIKESEIIKKRIINILHNEFNIDCQLDNSPHHPNLKKLRLTSEAEQKYIHKSRAEQRNTRIRIIDVIEKGTKDNPFENIYEACDFVCQEEKKYYQKDTYLNTTIAKTEYFYDPTFKIFRLPWAMPHVTLYKNDLHNNGFFINHLLSGRFSIKPNLYGRKFLYRGQSQYFDPCVPSLFRDKKCTYFLQDLIWGQEMRLLIKSHPLVKLLELGIDILHDNFIFEMNYGGLTQHYYNKSPFLDLTSDIEAAKFFAVTNYSSEKDEYNSVLDTNNLGVLYYYSIEMPTAFLEHPNYHLSTIGKQVFMRSGAQHGFLLRIDKGLNFNSLKETHKVFFKHHPSISEEIFERSQKGHIFFPEDALEKAWKMKMDENKKCPKVSIETVKYNHFLNRNETISSLINKLEKEGISVDKSYTPCFTPELLKEYYTDIKNGWWDYFCEDIYFYGSDGDLYKDELRNIQYRNEYKWAFHKWRPFR